MVQDQINRETAPSCNITKNGVTTQEVCIDITVRFTSNIPVGKNLQKVN